MFKETLLNSFNPAYIWEGISFTISFIMTGQIIMSVWKLLKTPLNINECGLLRTDLHIKYKKVYQYIIIIMFKYLKFKIRRIMFEGTFTIYNLCIDFYWAVINYS
jgi:hypothetical protein